MSYIENGKITQAGIDDIVITCGRKTANGGNVRNIIAHIEHLIETEGITDFFMTNTTDYKWGLRKNRDISHSFERVGVHQPSRNYNLYIWLEYWEET